MGEDAIPQFPPPLHRERRRIEIPPPDFQHFGWHARIQSGEGFPPVRVSVPCTNLIVGAIDYQIPFPRYRLTLRPHGHLYAGIFGAHKNLGSMGAGYKDGPSCAIGASLCVKFLSTFLKTRRTCVKCLVLLGHQFATSAAYHMAVILLGLPAHMTQNHILPCSSMTLPALSRLRGRGLHQIHTRDSHVSSDPLRE